MPGQMTNRFPSILEPGPSKVEAARAIETRRRGFGVFPYQWRIPGPNSRQVTANGAQLSPGPGNTVNLVTYTVPEGFLFVLQAIVMFGFASDWNEGSGDVLWTLSVAGPAPRKVQWFVDVKFHLGSPTNPYPILGKLEFQPMDVLSLNVNVVATVAVGPPNSFVGVLSGYEYPLSEAV